MDRLREKITKQKATSKKVYNAAVFFTFLAVPATAWLVIMIFMLLLKGIDDSLTITLAVLFYFAPFLVDSMCVALWIAYNKLNKSIEINYITLRMRYYAGDK